jgi:ribonucleoside-diphosphate reductase alpha chain
MNDSVLEQLRLKYFLRDEKGELIETEPEEMFHRVAKAIASVESNATKRKTWEDTFYELMSSYTFMPNSPCLMNAGTEIGSLAACFVVDIDDSRAGIAQTLGEAMEIFASGGGVGFPFSKLRAKGDLVSSTKGRASGPVSFAHMYDAMTETIMQGGKRRGASMGTLRVDHPDVLEFIHVKRNKIKLNNFNLSVLMTHEFMEAVENDLPEFWARDPRTGERRGFNKLDGTVGPISPSDIMRYVVDGGWSDGEPGVYFIDNAQDANPFPDEDDEMRILGPNPCGEAVLRSWESCVLGSINLTKFVKDGWFDFKEFSKVVEKCVRFLDNVIDVSVPPLTKIAESTRETRKIGLGVMGLHDALLMLGLPYSLSKSEETVDMVGTIFSTMKTSAEKASEALAIERGPFPAINRSTIFPPRRNAMLISIAPTGTIARVCDVSFGIEPINYWKTSHELVDIKYEQVHPLANIYFQANLPLPEYFETSLEISPEDHLAMQALVQKYADQAISKTIMFPNSATKEDIAPLYVQAWRKGIKGFTVYRDGSRSGQPISSSDAECQQEAVEHFHKERIRADSVYGPSYKVHPPEGNIYVDIHHNSNDEVVEVMLQLGDGFTDTEKGLANWGARLISKSLQHGIDYDEIVKQGASTEFEHKSRAYPGRVFWFGTNGKRKAYRSIPEVVSDLIVQEVNRMALGPDDDEPFEGEVETIQLRSANEHVCPSCGSTMEYVEGCLACQCGYSRCA